MVVIFNRKDILEHTSESEREEVETLLTLGLEAVKAADGYLSVRKALSRKGNVLKVAGREYDLTFYEHVYIIGIGKSSESMARAVYDTMSDRIRGGIVLVKSGKRTHEMLGEISILEGGHPIPTRKGYENAQILTRFVKEAPKENTLFFVLLSGGGSSIYADFHPDLTVEEGILLNRLLVYTDASILEINAVRKHTAEGKGGQLARMLQGADIISLILSDVPQNLLDTVASGPVSPDTTTFFDAKEMLDKYRLWNAVPESVKQRITKGVRHEIPETPKQKDPCFAQVHSVVVADAVTSCRAATKKIKELYGKEYPVTVYPDVMTGKVSEDLARTLLDNSRLGFTLIGHEYTYGADPEKAGEGGRQLHLLLLMLKIMKEAAYSNMYIEGIATDGKDGNSWAGALITPSLVRNTNREEIKRAEREENSGGFFREKGCLIRMKSEYGLDDTGTNVNNILIIHTIT